MRLTTDETYRERCSVYTVYIDFMYFAEQVKKNDIVLLDNEEILLKVEVVSANTITCKIERGGMLGSYKDVFVPNKVIQMPDFTDRDKSDIELAMRHQVRYKLCKLFQCSNFYHHGFICVSITKFLRLMVNGNGFIFKI